MSITFTADIQDTVGTRILPIEKLISIEAARSFNTTGSATLTLPMTVDKRMFKYNTRMKLWRRSADGTGSLFGDTVWFARKINHTHKDKFYTVEFEDAFSLLNLRLVAYTSDTLYADKTLETYALITYDVRFHIDNMMRQYVRENYGLLSEVVARRNPLIVVEDDRNLAPYGEKTASWQRLGDTLLDLARQSSDKGMELFFDLVPQNNGTFLFKVWDTVRGVNRGSDSPSILTLSEHMNHLTEISESDDYSNVGSYVYVLGYDTGPSQIIGEVSNDTVIRADPFGRIEYTITDSDVSVVSVLEDEGKASLRGRRPRRNVSARVLDGSGIVYGRDYRYGDRVLAHIGQSKYNCHINAVHSRWENGAEDLEIRLSGQEIV